jgi:hypothetical protein
VRTGSDGTVTSCAAPPHEAPSCIKLLSTFVTYMDPGSVGHAPIDLQRWITVSMLDPVQRRFDGLDPSWPLLQPSRPRLTHR